MTRTARRVRRRPAAPPADAKPAPESAPLTNRGIRRLFPGIGNSRRGLDDILRSANPVIPPRTVARRTLLVLIAIMSFLACLSIAAVSIVAEKASNWQRQIAEEITIQVRPVGGGDVNELVRRGVEVALQVPGVRSASAISAEDSAALLEPWLGRDFEAASLPIPRLIAVRVAADADLAALDRRLREEVPGATLDDHGLWLDRLSGMAVMMTLAGTGVVVLVLAATALSIIFATRGAMASNREVIDVLNFIGAEDSYVASEFQRHFLLLGLKGAAMGGAAAMALFLLARLLTGLGGLSAEEARIRSIFGGLQVGLQGYLGTVAIVVVVAFAVALTARMTVQRTIAELD